MREVLIIAASPKGARGNSASIARFAHKILNSEETKCKITYFKSEKRSMDEVFNQINAADVILVSFPVYQNSVPGSTMELFEMIFENKSKLHEKERELFAIANSGFAEKNAGNGAIKTCELFARDCGFVFMGGFTVAPGTLIDGKDLEETGGTYRRLMRCIGRIGECVGQKKQFPVDELRLMGKPFISPLLYRTVGRLIQNSVIKKLGKEQYFAKPLQALVS